MQRLHFLSKASSLSLKGSGGRLRGIASSGYSGTTKDVSRSSAIHASRPPSSSRTSWCPNSSNTHTVKAAQEFALSVLVLPDVPGETTRNVERHLAGAAAHSPIPQLSAGSYAPRAALFTRTLVSSSRTSPASAASTSTLRFAPRALRSEMTLSMLMLRSSPFSAAYTVRKGTPDAQRAPCDSGPASRAASL